MYCQTYPAYSTVYHEVQVSFGNVQKQSGCGDSETVIKVRVECDGKTNVYPSTSSHWTYHDGDSASIPIPGTWSCSSHFLVALVNENGIATSASGDCSATFVDDDIQWTTIGNALRGNSQMRTGKVPANLTAGQSQMRTGKVPANLTVSDPDADVAVPIEVMVSV